MVRVVGEKAVLNNPGFANVETYDLSQLTGQAAVTLGGNATGLQSLVGSAGGDTIFSAVALGSATWDAGAGDDRFAFDTKARFAAASLAGGAGSDTLALTQSVTGLVDADLARVGGVDTLSLTGVGNTATLGGNAEKAGIRTVVAGEGNARVDVSGYAATRGVEVRFRNDADLVSSTVSGGAGSDTVAFTEDGLTLRDSIFSPNIKAVDALRMPYFRAHFAEKEVAVLQELRDKGTAWAREWNAEVAAWDAQSAEELLRRVSGQRAPAAAGSGGGGGV
jgi:hypothetical protein